MGATDAMRYGRRPAGLSKTKATTSYWGRTTRLSQWMAVFVTNFFKREGAGTRPLNSVIARCYCFTRVSVSDRCLKRKQGQKLIEDAVSSMNARTAGRIDVVNRTYCYNYKTESEADKRSTHRLMVTVGTLPHCSPKRLGQLRVNRMESHSGTRKCPRPSWVISVWPRSPLAHDSTASLAYLYTCPISRASQLRQRIPALVC